MTKECTRDEGEKEKPHPSSVEAECARTPGLSSSLALNGLFDLAVFYTLFFARYFLLPPRSRSFFQPSARSDRPGNGKPESPKECGSRHRGTRSRCLAARFGFLAH